MSLPRLTLSPVVAVALVHRLATLAVVEKCPTWACTACKGSGKTPFPPHNEAVVGGRPCPVCDSSLGERGALIEIWSNEEPPTEGAEFGSHVVIYGRLASIDYGVMVAAAMGASVGIPLPLGSRIGALRLTDALPIVSVDDEDGPPLPALTVGDGHLTWWTEGFDGFSDTCIDAELAWQDFPPGRFALVTEPEDA